MAPVLIARTSGILNNKRKTIYSHNTPIFKINSKYIRNHNNEFLLKKKNENTKTHLVFKENENDNDKKDMNLNGTPIYQEYSQVIVQEVPDDYSTSTRYSYRSSSFSTGEPAQVEEAECIVLTANEELLHREELQRYIKEHQDHSILTLIECDNEFGQSLDDSDRTASDADADADDDDEDAGFALYYVEEPIFEGSGTPESSSSPPPLQTAQYTYSYEIEEINDNDDGDADGEQDIDMF